MATTVPDSKLGPNGETQRTRLLVDEGPQHWTLVATEAREGALARHSFREYLERYGHPASDFDAAEAVYGELVNTCVEHAPGAIRIEFRWDDTTLIVIDARDRLRSWPFSPEDMRAESTHHAHALISALTRRIHLSRDPGGGTRASVPLPVMRAET